MQFGLAAAYERCRELHKRHGRSYYLATRLLPAWKRRHVHALYGFTRYADEIVDRTDKLPPAQRAARLIEWSDRFVAGLHGEPIDDPLLPAVLHTIATFNLDRTDFARFLDSMAMDLTVTSYATYDDLLHYMEGSAAAIGTMM
ncbi:MAG TPA: squalene/phytoene synthase family protein, partial [Micromonosporaceae bacterium]|nr:squalene/phytoene synthase family protein [Micromonosporaceae bacterium]